MSPAALGQLMAVELTMLDGVEESLRQVTDVDRSRAVTLAQQETVSLAQILKVGEFGMGAKWRGSQSLPLILTSSFRQCSCHFWNVHAKLVACCLLQARKQEHNQEMTQLQLKAQQESLEASRQLEEARQRAADATQNANKAIQEARADSAASHQDTTAKLIQTQQEAARATAEAARQLAEVSVLAGQDPDFLNVLFASLAWMREQEAVCSWTCVFLSLLLAENFPFFFFLRGLMLIV